MSTQSITLRLGSLLLLLASAHASATQVDRVTLDQAVRDAGLIFQGTVTKIESRSASDMGSNYVGMYYAFVTFRVEHLLKGQIEGNSTTFTLPFENCLALDYSKAQKLREQNPTMTQTEVLAKMLPFTGTAQTPEVRMGCGTTGMPTFDIGESDILFVLQNVTDGTSPVVGWWQGRYSIVNNKIYPVTWTTDKGGLDFTAPYGQKDEQDAEKRGEALPLEAKKHHWEPDKGAKRVGPNEFIEVVERMVRNLEQTEFMAGKSSPPPVKSADFNDPMYYSSAKWHYEQAQEYEEWVKEKRFNGIPQEK